MNEDTNWETREFLLQHEADMDMWLKEHRWLLLDVEDIAHDIEDEYLGRWAGQRPTNPFLVSITREAINNIKWRVIAQRYIDNFTGYY